LLSLHVSIISPFLWIGKTPHVLCIYTKKPKNSTQTYIGSTTDVTARLAKHNEGGSSYTAKHKPWNLFWYRTFPTKK
jgi:predicted GIY-YIG superfamily endonuclease